MRDWLPYTIIFCDICLRYYHMAFVTRDAAVEWFVFLTTETVRKLETPIAMLFLVIPLNGLARKIVWAWAAWLMLDFIEQVNDLNYGGQFWELGLFVIACIIIIYVHWRKNGKMV